MNLLYYLALSLLFPFVIRAAQAPITISTLPRDIKLTIMSNLWQSAQDNLSNVLIDIARLQSIDKSWRKDTTSANDFDFLLKYAQNSLHLPENVAHLLLSNKKKLSQKKVFSPDEMQECFNYLLQFMNLQPQVCNALQYAWYKSNKKIADQSSILLPDGSQINTMHPNTNYGYQLIKKDNNLQRDLDFANGGFATGGIDVMPCASSAVIQLPDGTYLMAGYMLPDTILITHTDENGEPFCNFGKDGRMDIPITGKQKISSVFAAEISTSADSLSADSKYKIKTITIQGSYQTDTESKRNDFILSVDVPAKRQKILFLDKISE